MKKYQPHHRLKALDGSRWYRRPAEIICGLACTSVKFCARFSRSLSQMHALLANLLFPQVIKSLFITKVHKQNSLTWSSLKVGRIMVGHAESWVEKCLTSTVCNYSVKTKTEHLVNHPLVRSSQGWLIPLSFWHYACYLHLEIWQFLS